MSLGRTIRIYLDDGSVTGVKHAEIVNWTGQAISCPRQHVKSLNDWPESKKPGCYFLYGVDDESGEPAVYIGEAENVYDRVLNHLANKDFWNEIVFFTSKDENLTKSHVKFLESELVKAAKNANRQLLLNGNTPNQPTLPRSEQASMKEYFQNLKTLLGVLGHKTLEPLIHKPSNFLEKKLDKLDELASETKLFLNVKGLEAQAILNDEGIVVTEGSFASKLVKDSLSNGYKKLRTKLIDSGVVIDNGNNFVFTQDYLFTSPSQAAAVLVGYAINGRNHWLDSSGISLKELETNS
ncbi:GIY-YIG nuclease family protein [Pseudoalteromonas sp. CH_XMU1449-3]|uniref:GIY-YIG nuclease family protein n=1 Tax=Pseudoalteromonas sp. CH_XMU1449-3 TaxID=3107774 RepID=UPI00300A0254